MSFKLGVKAFAKKMGRDVNDIKRLVAIDIFGKIITESPVDTGRFRNNWNTSLNKPNYSTTLETDQSGQKAKDGILSVIQGAKVEDDIYLSNGLPYAKRLENGWSRQAPTGMVRINVARFSSAMKQAVQGRLK